MSGHRSGVLQRSGPSEERESSGDSNILRYIKTLTNHQTNAKQQRMDQYLKQVKHTQSTAENVGKPSRYSSTTGNQQSSVSKMKVPESRQENKLSDSYSKARKERKTQGKVVGLVKKRPYHGNQGSKQQKKPKQAPSKQQVATIGALDRFRLNGTWSQNKSQTASNAECADSKAPQHTTASAGKMVQAAALQTHKPQSAKPGSNADVQERRFEVLPSVQQTPKPLPTKARTAPAEAAVQEPWTNSNQHSFSSPQDIQHENSDCTLLQQAVHIPAYDPLSVTMESVYF